MRVFETATKELRFMHDESDLMGLEKVSADYYWAEQEIDKLEKELAVTVSEDARRRLSKLTEYFTTQQSITGEVFYNQGFADGIRLIIQSLTWGPVRR